MGVLFGSTIKLTESGTVNEGFNNFADAVISSHEQGQRNPVETQQYTNTAAMPKPTLHA